MGLVEILIAMTILSIGIMAIAAGFSSGWVALNRATKTSTAGALADKQMETYRRVRYASIALDPSIGLDPVYTGDAAYDATWSITNVCAGDATTEQYAYCNPSRSVTGPDGRSYRVDSFIRWGCVVPGSTLNAGSPPTCTPPVGDPVASRAVKLVSVVVRDGSDNSRVWFRATSTFDAATG